MGKYYPTFFFILIMKYDFHLIKISTSFDFNNKRFSIHSYIKYVTNRIFCEWNRIYHYRSNKLSLNRHSLEFSTDKFSIVHKHSHESSLRSQENGWRTRLICLFNINVSKGRGRGNTGGGGGEAFAQKRNRGVSLFRTEQDEAIRTKETHFL